MATNVVAETKATLFRNVLMKLTGGSHVFHWGRSAKYLDNKYNSYNRYSSLA